MQRKKGLSLTCRGIQESWKVNSMPSGCPPVREKHAMEGGVSAFKKPGTKRKPVPTGGMVVSPALNTNLNKLAKKQE